MKCWFQNITHGCTSAAVWCRVQNLHLVWFGWPWKWEVSCLLMFCLHSCFNICGCSAAAPVKGALVRYHCTIRYNLSLKPVVVSKLVIYCLMITVSSPCADMSQQMFLCSCILLFVLLKKMTSLLKFSAYQDNLLVLFSRCCFYFADVFVSVVVDEDELYNCFVQSESVLHFVCLWFLFMTLF